MTHPRVAIVSANPVRRDQPNGILMRSLFLGWPRERLSQIFFPVVVYHSPDQGVCGEYRLIRPWGGVRRLVADDRADADAGNANGGTPRRGVQAILRKA